jgi:hypothetical protein
MLELRIRAIPQRQRKERKAIRSCCSEMPKNYQVLCITCCSSNNNIQQIMQMPDGTTQKGLRQILHERGVNTAGLLKAEMITILNSYPDFQNQKASE